MTQAHGFQGSGCIFCQFLLMFCSPLFTPSMTSYVNHAFPHRFISQSIFYLIYFMSHTEQLHSLSDGCKMSEWVISSCLDEWQSDTLWCGAEICHFAKCCDSSYLSIVGFSSRLGGIIDLSSASSSTIPLLLLSRQQFIKHLHLLSFFASTDKGCQMWCFQYLCARLDRDKRLTSSGFLYQFTAYSRCFPLTLAHCRLHNLLIWFQSSYLCHQEEDVEVPFTLSYRLNKLNLKTNSNSFNILEIFKAQWDVSKQIIWTHLSIWTQPLVHIQL